MAREATVFCKTPYTRRVVFSLGQSVGFQMILNAVLRRGRRATKVANHAILASHLRHDLVAGFVGMAVA